MRGLGHREVPAQHSAHVRLRDDGPDGSGWVDALEAFGVASLIAAHVEELGVERGVRCRLLTLRELGVRAALRQSIDTAVASRALDAAGVDHLVLGGVALAHLVGRPLVVRADGPIRLWVPASEWAVAEAVLASAGWSQSTARAGRFAHRSRCEVELVTALAPQRWLGRQAFTRVVEESVPLAHIGPTVRTVPPALALLDAAQRCRVVDRDWIASVADVADIASVCSPDELADARARAATVRFALAASLELGSPSPQAVSASGWLATVRARRAWAKWRALPSPVGASPRRSARWMPAPATLDAASVPGPSAA